MKNRELLRDPDIIAEFRDRVERGNWPAARRLSLALGLYSTTPPHLRESTANYYRRLAAMYAGPPMRRVLHRPHGFERRASDRRRNAMS